VDEAHGAHFYFSEKFPPGALQAGADAAVTSVHKTLGGLSGTALLNLASHRLDANKVKLQHMMSADQVSPFLLADLEGCVQTFSKKGEAMIE
jgi:arginine/lysine/ornithine decarboxylase